MARDKGRRRKRRPKGRARERGASITFTFELDPRLDQALEACAARDRRTKKAVVSIALEEYFQRIGLWPPPDQAGNPE